VERISANCGTHCAGSKCNRARGMDDSLLGDTRCRLVFVRRQTVPAATAEITTLEVFLTGGKIALFTAGIGLCGAFAVEILRGTKDKWNYILAAAVSLTTAILLLGYLSFFAVSVYARIPSVIGGGADTHVRLVLALDPTKAMRLGIPDDGVTTLRLLFVTSNMYYIVSPRTPRARWGSPARPS